jgi:hypothetical protein
MICLLMSKFFFVDCLETKRLKDLHSVYKRSTLNPLIDFGLKGRGVPFESYNSWKMEIIALLIGSLNVT